MFGTSYVDEFSWRDDEHKLDAAAKAYARDFRKFAERTANILSGIRMPSIDDLLVGHPPLHDCLADDVEFYVARSRQLASASERLRDDLRDFGICPSSDGAARVFDTASETDPGSFEEHRLEEIRLRAAWYGALFGNVRLKRELISVPRSFELRRITYGTGLAFQTGGLHEVSGWKIGFQEEIYRNGHLILRRLGAGVELVDFMQDNHHAVCDVADGRGSLSGLFALADTDPEDEPVAVTVRRVLENDAEARRALADRAASAIDDIGIGYGDDVAGSATDPDTITIAELLGTPRIRVLGPVPDVGTSDQKTFARSFSTLANVGTPLVVASDVARIAADLGAQWPHAVDIVHRILADVRDGEPIRMRPILLVGSPGSGKTSLLGGIARRLGLPSVVYPCASVADGSFGGTPAQWHSRRASTPLQLIRTSGRANPAVILDEIEKSGVSPTNGSLVHSLLPMLEPHSAASYFETALEQTADLSGVVFLATANDLGALPDPLRDRFRVLRMPDATIDHLPALAAGIVLDIAHERSVPADLVPALAPDELGVVAKAWGGGSLRKLKAAIATTLDVRDEMAVRQ